MKTSSTKEKIIDADNEPLGVMLVPFLKRQPGRAKSGLEILTFSPILQFTMLSVRRKSTAP